MSAYVAGPLLELNKAVPSFEESGLPPVPFSMRLMPGDCVFVDVHDLERATMFADVCSGLVPLESGSVQFMGLDWTSLKDRELNALRGRIGRITKRRSWPEFVPMHIAIMLQQLHHTTRPQDEVLLEAANLAERFGLPGLPMLSPSLMSEADLCRAGCVRAFLGKPQLLLLEDPLEGAPQELLNAFLGAVTQARDHGAGVIWLARGNTIGRYYRQGITSTLRLTDNGLVAVRMG
ncbi:P-loop NTPase family protein [Acetobacter vaccinii]|uniref:ABC transporter ATP-binding protein n=1 Tax=Acetobacter vaccinii TaxID=2592655 RepID=A0A5C1YKS0_9PROT|nr:ABC transporter ATP-binding protein [Acetobacter vaccinii]QEO16501.1 ABC transporter ATP-binding protein [Acetobacter vaccinii]